MQGALKSIINTGKICFLIYNYKQRENLLVHRRRSNMHTPSKVLWIRFGAFGDVLQAIARARLFKRKFPGAKLTMLTRPEYQNIVEPQDCFDDFIYWDSKKKPFGLLACVQDVRRRGFDTLVSVHNAVSAAFVSKLSGISKCYGYKSLFENFYYDKNVWQWFKELGIDKDLRDVPMLQASSAAKKYVAELLPNLSEKAVFCIPAASKMQKAWPLEYWPVFLERLIADGWTILLNGHGQEERRHNEKILSAMKNKDRVYDLTDKINYDQMCAVLKRCKAAVGNDTGPLHIAALSGTPTLGFFGVTPSQKIGFTMPWFREVLCTCPEVGCWNYKCPKRCLETISADMAYDGFKKLEKELLTI